MSFQGLQDMHVRAFEDYAAKEAHPQVNPLGNYLHRYAFKFEDGAFTEVSRSRNSRSGTKADCYFSRQKEIVMVRGKRVRDRRFLNQGSVCLTRQCEKGLPGSLSEKGVLSCWSIVFFVSAVCIGEQVLLPSRGRPQLQLYLRVLLSPFPRSVTSVALPLFHRSITSVALLFPQVLDEFRAFLSPGP